MAGTEPTVGDIVRALATSFRDAGIDTADLDARRLVSAALQLTPEHLITHAGTGAPPADRARLDDYGARRLAREPVSRILGSRDFYGRDFEIGPAVLDPRPETETLVELALSVIDRHADIRDADQPYRVLDIGIGSGAILVTLLAERDHIRGTGIDISEPALAIARANATAWKVIDRATIVPTSIADALTMPFDLIVANPPYIPSGDIAALDPEVVLYDPRLALDGGADGLDIYRDIFRALVTSPARPTVIVEVGPGQASDVVQLAQALWLSGALCHTAIASDLAGRARCVVLEPHI